jgi:hypothetical protein
MHSHVESIRAECESNGRIVEAMEKQKSWKALVGSLTGLPVEVLSLLEQSLIHNDIKLHGSAVEATLRRVLEMQLCVSAKG